MESPNACYQRERSVSTDESGLAAEIAILSEIYINELEVETNPEAGVQNAITLQLHPATADNTEQQFVCLTLTLNIPVQYPEKSPEIIVKNTRGLADEHIKSIRESLSSLAEESRGHEVLYDLIEMAKDSLTESNIPHGQCVICMQRFDEADDFMKTECYHFFHGYCLLHYINHSLAQQEEEAKGQIRHKEEKTKLVVCPVCREEISYDLDVLKNAKEPSGGDADIYKPSKEILARQKHFAKLYEKQRAKGGIIDVEAERNKYLIPSVTSSSGSRSGLTAYSASVTISTHNDVEYDEHIDQETNHPIDASIERSTVVENITCNIEDKHKSEALSSSNQIKFVNQGNVSENRGPRRYPSGHRTDRYTDKPKSATDKIKKEGVNQRRHWKNEVLTADKCASSGQEKQKHENKSIESQDGEAVETRTNENMNSEHLANEHTQSTSRSQRDRIDHSRSWRGYKKDTEERFHNHHRHRNHHYYHQKRPPHHHHRQSQKTASENELRKEESKEAVADSDGYSCASGKNASISCDKSKETQAEDDTTTKTANEPEKDRPVKTPSTETAQNRRFHSSSSHHHYMGRGRGRGRGYRLRQQEDRFKERQRERKNDNNFHTSTSRDTSNSETAKTLPLVQSNESVEEKCSDRDKSKDNTTAVDEGRETSPSASSKNQEHRKSSGRRNRQEYRYKKDSGSGWKKTNTETKSATNSTTAKHDNLNVSN